MNPSDIVLAAALIAAPIGSDPGVPAERYPAVRDAVSRLAVEREILDPREARYYFTGGPDEFADCLDALRRRSLALDGAPMTADGAWLPDPATACDLIRFNREFRSEITRRRVWEPDREALYDEVIGETDRLYRVWDAVREARSDCFYVTWRREALLTLRNAIGTEAWARNELPPAVPHWRFRPSK